MVAYKLFRVQVLAFRIRCRFNVLSLQEPHRIESVTSEFNPFYFVERNFIFSPIVEFRGTGRLMRCDLLSVFERAAVLKIGRNPSRPKSMATGGVGEPGSFGPSLDHVKHVTAYHRIVGELVASFKGPE